MQRDGKLPASAVVAASRVDLAAPPKGPSALEWKLWAQRLTRNAGAKLLSLVIAIGVWFTVTNQIEFPQTLVFPIEYKHRPEGLTPVEALPTEVRMRVNGKGKFLRYTLRNVVCSVDLSGSQIGQNTVAISGTDANVPRDAPVRSVTVVEPTHIRVEFDETVIRDVPIMANIIGDPAPRYTQVGKTFVNPPIARVKGPRRIVDEIALLSTREIDIDGNRSTVRKKAKLARPDAGTVEVTPETVEVGITIEPLVIRTIEDVELAVAQLPNSNWRSAFHPRTVDIQISGARSIVEVAAREVSSLVFSAADWSLGTSSLRFKQTGGREIVFAPQDSFPLVTAPAHQGTNGDPPAGPDHPAGTVPPALHGEMMAMLPLPRDVHVLSVDPPELVVAIQKNDVQPSP
jgi:hypothetical protein